MAYRKGAMTRHVVEEDTDIANTDIKISPRSPEKYELKERLFNNILANCQKVRVKMLNIKGVENGPFHNVGTKWSILFFRAI